MKITIEFNTDNQAFKDSPWHEMTTVLDRAFKILTSGDVDFHPGVLHDSNGNSIGTVSVEAETE